MIFSSATCATPGRTTILRLEMTNKVRAVAESHPLRNIRHALLRVLQQPASIAQPGAADKFAGRFAEFCVEQAVELAFTQCHFSRKPGGGERPGQELFNQHDGAAQPRVRDKRKIRRTWGGNFMRNERQTLTGGAGDIIPGMGADKLSCQRQGGNTARQVSTSPSSMKSYPCSA